MAETFTIQFTPTQQDYVRITRSLLFRGLRTWLAIGGTALVELCLLFAVLNNSFTRVPFAWVFVLVLPALYLWFFVGLPYKTGRSASGNERLLAEITWELSEDVVILKNRYQETKYDWGSFLSLTENRDYFFLRQAASPRLYNFIPKRAFASLEQQAQFHELVDRHISGSTAQAAAASRSSRWVPFVVLILVIALFCIVFFGVELFMFVRDAGRLQLPAPATPPATPTMSASTSLAGARVVMSTKSYKDAIPLLDQAIRLDPHNGDAYYLRAYSYAQVATTELVYPLHVQEVQQALQDIDHAIEYGVTDPNVPRGEPYFLRFEIWGVTHAATNADVAAMQPILRENLRMAEALGTYNKYDNQYIVYTYFGEHDCQGGMAELQRIRGKYGLSAPPNSTIYFIEAQVYACFGQYDKALEDVDKSISIESFPVRLSFRALMLYYLGRKQDGLDILDKLIAADPQFGGDRYYLRALMEYDLGNSQKAAADLSMGDRYSWDHAGIAAYVRGRMAYDRGEKSQAAVEFQSASITIRWLYDPIRADAVSRLAALGKPVPADAPSGQYHPTPMPPAPALPTPDFPVAANGLQLPPSPTPVGMASGTGGFAATGVNAYPVFLFQPPQPLKVRSVQSLTIHIQPTTDTSVDKFEIFIWNPTTGDWTMFKKGWQDMPVSDPAQYVASNGEVYVALRTDSGVDIYIKQLWLTLQLTPSGGAPITIDVTQ